MNQNCICSRGLDYGLHDKLAHSQGKCGCSWIDENDQFNICKCINFKRRSVFIEIKYYFTKLVNYIVFK